MPEWWTYTLSDFLLFSPRTYYRLLELYNLAVWPAQLVGAAIGLTVAASLLGRGPWPGRVGTGLLAACWLWIAWAFHLERYAQINWAAPWFAAAFTLQGILLLGLAVVAGRFAPRDPGPKPRSIAGAFVMVIVVAYPLLAPLGGRPWTTGETFGAAPDPTAIVTIAALALADAPLRWLLLAIPVLWCAIAVATLWAMAAPEAVVVAGGALIALSLSVAFTSVARQDTGRPPSPRRRRRGGAA